MDSSYIMPFIQSIQNVFETMIQLPVQVGKPTLKEAGAPSFDISGIIGMSGDVEGSVLRHAPHPAEDIVADDWDRRYARELAAYPVPSLRHSKYWVPVGRIDNAYGDRNVMCECPPIEAYES